MKKQLFRILLAASILLNFYLLIRQQDMSPGGGQQKVSPDGRFIAAAMSKRQANPFVREHGLYGELTLRSESIAKPPLITVLIRPEAIQNEMAYRELSGLIQWNAASTEATFTTPAGRFTLNVPKP